MELFLLSTIHSVIPWECSSRPEGNGFKPNYTENSKKCLMDGYTKCKPKAIKYQLFTWYFDVEPSNHEMSKKLCSVKTLLR